MRRACFVLVVAAGTLAVGTFGPDPSHAAAARNGSGYKPVPVTIVTAPRDAKLDAFRKELAAIAAKKDRAQLARLVAKEIFWERDFGNGFDRKKSAFDNLAAALGIESGDGSGWDALAVFAAEPTVGPFADRAGVVCAPAPPRYSDAELEAVIKATRSDGVEWSHPRAAGVQVYARPDTKAPVIETLGLALVRVVGFEAKESDVDPTRTAWAQVITPAGKSGYAPPGTLMSLFVDRLCFAKDAAGAWRIAGYVGGGD